MERPVDYGRDVRDTVVKSSLTGVAATVLAVTIFSPAGVGGLIGTSVASSFGGNLNSTAASDDPYANLPAFPAPLSAEELSNIRGQLARSTASLAITRAATEPKLEHIRSIALSSGVVTFTPMPQQQAQLGGLRGTLSEPATFAATPAAASASPAATIAPVPAAVHATPINYTAAASATAAYRDPHLELADLLLAHEQF
jgi:hypothetical protein